MSCPRACVLACCAILLSGCASLPCGEAGEVAALLDYSKHLMAMPAREQARAYQAAQADFKRQPGDDQRLRLALAVSLPDAPWRDDTLALRLIAKLADRGRLSESPRRDFAVALQQSISERLRMRQEQLKLQNQLHDEQQRAGDLQEKLNALRAIDRDTNRRIQHQ